MPDLPGFGESDRPADADYRAADQVARLAAFASVVGVERFHLGGNSMGGLIAAALAAAHPERVLSLWLLAPAGVKTATPSELMQKLEAGEKLPIFARNATEVREMLAFACYRPPRVPGFVIEAMARDQREHFDLNERIAYSLFEGH